MIDFPDYYIATNKAYATLIKYKVFSFPISPKIIIRQLSNVAIHTYSDLAKRMGISREVFLDYLSSSEHGFTARQRDKYAVFYNEQKDDTTIRFTLAHELGHIILGHIEDGKRENKEANCFARNLLCPVPIIKEMNIQTEKEYTEAFNISEPMAYCAIQNLKSDFYYITKENYNIYNDKVYSHYTGMSFAEMYSVSIEAAYY